MFMFMPISNDPVDFSEPYPLAKAERLYPAVQTHLPAWQGCSAAHRPSGYPHLPFHSGPWAHLQGAAGREGQYWRLIQV